MMKRRQVRIGVLVLFCVLFFCGGVFLSASWNSLRAQYEGGAKPENNTGAANYNSAFNGMGTGNMVPGTVTTGNSVPGGGIGGSTSPGTGMYSMVGTEAGGSQVNPALMAITGGQPVNVARPLEVPPLYAFGSKVNESCQQIVLVDSKTKRICVYYIRSRDNKSTIEMVATHNFEWDLKLDDFNVEGISSMQIKEQVLKSGEKH